MAHIVPEKKWSDLFAYLAQKEVQRRTVVKKGRTVTSVSVVEEKVQKENESVNLGFPRKPIKPSLKKSVLREQPYCQFKDPESGKICASTRFLQIDHIQSVRTGGGNERENLQILCGRHNRFKFEKELSLQPQQR